MEPSGKVKTISQKRNCITLSPSHPSSACPYAKLNCHLPSRRRQRAGLIRTFCGAFPLHGPDQTPLPFIPLRGASTQCAGITPLCKSTSWSSYVSRISEPCDVLLLFLLCGMSKVDLLYLPLLLVTHPAERNRVGQVGGDECNNNSTDSSAGDT